MREGHDIAEELRRDCPRERGELCLNGDDELSIAAPASRDNLACRSLALMVSSGRELATANRGYSCVRCPLKAALTGEPMRINPG